jgi:hypothetical protein
MNRGVVPQIGFTELNLAVQMLDILRPAPPALKAEDLDLRLLGQKIVRQMGPGKTRDPGYEYSHRMPPEISPVRATCSVL